MRSRKRAGMERGRTAIVRQRDVDGTQGRMLSFQAEAGVYGFCAVQESP